VGEVVNVLAVPEMFNEWHEDRHYAERDWARLDAAIVNLNNIFSL
jgi:hypothetical protein